MYVKLLPVGIATVDFVDREIEKSRFLLLFLCDNILKFFTNYNLLNLILSIYLIHITDYIDLLLHKIHSQYD